WRQILDRVIDACLPYLSCRQPIKLQEACLRSCVQSRVVAASSPDSPNKCAAPLGQVCGGHGGPAGACGGRTAEPPLVTSPLMDGGGAFPLGPLHLQVRSHAMVAQLAVAEVDDAAFVLCPRPTASRWTDGAYDALPSPDPEPAPPSLGDVIDAVKAAFEQAVQISTTGAVREALERGVVELKTPAEQSPAVETAVDYTTEEAAKEEAVVLTAGEPDAHMLKSGEQTNEEPAQEGLVKIQSSRG
ncbi:hypothetical protein QQF64_020373, partial [Cirrhinus molitorella]